MPTVESTLANGARRELKKTVSLWQADIILLFPTAPFPNRIIFICLFISSVPFDAEFIKSISSELVFSDANGSCKGLPKKWLYYIVESFVEYHEISLSDKVQGSMEVCAAYCMRCPKHQGVLPPIVLGDFEVCFLSCSE